MALLARLLNLAWLTRGASTDSAPRLGVRLLENGSRRLLEGGTYRLLETE